MITGITQISFLELYGWYSGLEIAIIFFKNKNCDSTRKRSVLICVSHPCYQFSSLLPLVGNRDDSNRDDIKYENSHLLCSLETKS